MAGRQATLHLRVLGQDMAASFAVPAGAISPQQALPAAYAIVDAVTGAAVAAAAEAGRAVSCRQGCAACCRQMVTLAPVEAMGIADLVLALPPENQEKMRRRFEIAIERTRAAGLVEPGSADDVPVLRAPPATSADAALDGLLDAYFALQIDCPFLENESCGIYARRPAVCREYLITSPAENCSDVGRKQTVGVPLPVYMSDKLVGFGVAGEGGKRKIPLPFALAWAATHRHQMKAADEPRQVLSELVTLLDTEAMVPFGKRSETG